MKLSITGLKDQNSWISPSIVDICVVPNEIHIGNEIRKLKMKYIEKILQSKGYLIAVLKIFSKSINIICYVFINLFILKLSILEYVMVKSNGNCIFN